MTLYIVVIGGTTSAPPGTIAASTLAIFPSTTSASITIPPPLLVSYPVHRHHCPASPANLTGRIAQVICMKATILIASALMLLLLLFPVEYLAAAPVV